MVPGQAPISLVTDNVRVTVTHDLVTSLKNANLAPPKTAAEVIYSAVSFKGNCLACHLGSHLLDLTFNPRTLF